MAFWVQARSWLLGLLAAVVIVPAAQAQAVSRNLAPGFAHLPKDAKVLVAPLDVELFSVTAGGVLEPKADWTAAAQGHMKVALDKHVRALGLDTLEIDTAKADELAELLSLHAAVAGAISVHHFGMFALPTKEGKLNWSFGEALRPLQQAAGARYALFTFVRDSYTSAERVAMMVVLALAGVGVGGGAQVGYASLVDMETGQVLWFNQLVRADGDLRVADKAAETVGALLKSLPAAK